jgi:aspartate/glutamate racemase
VKTIGIVGGIGPESTVDYYRAVISAYRERQSDGSYPSIIILLAIIDRMKKRDGIDAVILGGTELPLILRDATASGIPLLDTTQMHAKAIVDHAWRTES